MNNIHYVYEYVRLDTNEPFYIGKGTGNRWKQLTKDRNKYFKNIVNHRDVAVVILHDNLDEDTALQYECWHIWQLRDVQGYWLANQTDGGEGIAGYKHTEETKQKIARKNKISMKGKKKSEEHKLNLSKSRKWRFKGKDNPNYGNGDKIRGNKNASYGKFGANSKRAKPINLVDENGVVVEKFACRLDLYKPDWRKNYPKPNNPKYISECLKNNKPFHGFRFVYVEKVLN